MQTLTLRRQISDDEGTFGLLVGLPRLIRTVELPWRKNSSKVSCIPLDPIGYICKWVNSPKHGWCYELQNVKGRGNIQIHTANYGGDVTKGFRSDLLGCIGLGADVTTNTELKPPQRMVTNSRETMKFFHACMKKESFLLIISGCVG